MNTRQMFDHVFVPYVAIASCVFGVVLCVLFFAVLRYRAGRGHDPSQKAEHRLVESLYAVVLTGVAVFLAVYVGVANVTERQPVRPPRLHVTIVAFQWCWDFEYVHTKVAVDGNCSRGYPTLVVPTHEPVEFSLISADVVHEWWLPEVRYKEEAFPHHFNNFEVSFPATGHFEGRCDEFCGLYHDRMEFLVRVVPPRSFTHWLAAQRARSSAGTGSA